MPIRIPDSLPATEVLEGENIFVMTEYRAMHQDIRPLKVLLLNLMPTKIVTETQIMRKLSNTPLQIEVSLLQTASHEAKNVLSLIHISRRALMPSCRLTTWERRSASPPCTTALARRWARRLPLPGASRTRCTPCAR